jgi:predicted acetyltransferase
MGYIFSGMIEDTLKENDIPYLKKGRIGAAMSIMGLSNLEDYNFYVPFAEHERAKKLIEFGSAQAVTVRMELPAKEHSVQVEEYKCKMLEADSGMDGCGRLRDRGFDEWLKESDDHREGRNLPDGYVPATQYVAIREDDGKIVGMLQIRHNLDSPFLKQIGGHIGYSVAPDERRKGYATEMLRLALPLCGELGIDGVMVSCLQENIGSARVIMNNGGVLERTEEHEGKALDVYWIEGRG